MQEQTIRNGLMLSAASVLVALLLAESLLHFLHPVEYRSPPEETPRSAWRGLMHRPSSIPGLAYELAPNCEQQAQGTLIQTNSFGMRDDEPRSGGEGRLHRLIAVGDSFTFGFRVPGEATYPNVLERLLNDRGGVDRFEVLNLGVGGYSSRDEALLLRHKGMQWKPALVIVGYFLNDPEIDPVQPLHSHFQEPAWWQHSNLLRLVAMAKNRWDVWRLGDQDYYRYLHSPQRAKWQSVVDAFDEVARLTQERGVPALILIFPELSNRPWEDYPYPDLHRQVADAARRAGLQVVDLYDAFSQHPPGELLADDDEHPNEAGHEVAANAIHEWLCRKRKVAIPIDCR